MCTCYVSYAMPQFIKLMTTHYGSIPIKNCIIDICPLTPIFQGNKYLDVTRLFLYIFGLEILMNQDFIVIPKKIGQNHFKMVVPLALTYLTYISQPLLRNRCKYAFKKLVVLCYV